MKFKFLAALSLFLAMAQPAKSDDFDDFIGGAVSDFDNFIDQADKDFLNFLRSPWVHFDAEKPIEKRAVPEPLKAPVVNPDTVVSAVAPTRISVEEIIDKTNRESQSGVKAKQSSVQPIQAVNTQPRHVPDNKQTVKIDSNVNPNDKSHSQSSQKKGSVEGVAVERPTGEPRRQNERMPVRDVSAPKREILRDNVASVEDVRQPAEKQKVKNNLTHEGRTGSKPTRSDRDADIQRQEQPDVSIKGKSEKSVNPLYDGGPMREAIEFGGVTYYVDNKLKNSIRLKGISENNVADAYEKLLKSDYKQLLDDLNNLRKYKLGNDWALYKIIQKISESFVGKNESIVMRHFLLSKMGYKARMGRMANGKELALLYVPDCQLYACVYVDINGDRYFDVDNKTGSGFYICKQNAPGASQIIAMDINELPDMSPDRVKATRTDISNSTVSVDVSKSLIDFYSTLPQCDYSVYANATVEPELEKELLSQLRKKIEGKSETDAAEILLQFVQTGFKYQTDPQQFGYEKPFFVEELFYYPACDCEDRSVLYRYLVKKLLALDVVLLEYPNHVATAVKFTSAVEGDNIQIGKDKYIVCDPTYIGASIGMAMPSFKSVAAKVIKL